MSRFLLQVCDWYHCYAGCGNIDAMILVNEIYVGIWFAMLLASLVYPLEKLYSCRYIKKKPISQAWNFTMKMSVLSIATILSKIAVLLNARSVLAVTSYESLQWIITFNILLELLYGIVSFLYCFTYSTQIVRSFSAVNKENNASFVLSGTLSSRIHMALYICLLIFGCCFAFLGPRSGLSQYIVWRRVIYSWVAIVSFVIEPVLLFYCGSVAINHLLASDASRDEEGRRLDPIKRKILRLKSTIKHVCISQFLSGIFNMLIPILNEVYQDNEESLLISKIVLSAVQVLFQAIPLSGFFLPALSKIIMRTVGKAVGETSQSKTTGLFMSDQTKPVRTPLRVSGDGGVMQVETPAYGQLETVKLTFSNRSNE
ncbi:hypothetical protein HDV03_001785 [Kappamyces sp. JEL0829]|nr:hypothetical protein HDV03_001785 [Kappamyces sp. JEL0829]